MKQVGKIGRINARERAKIAEICERENLVVCLFQLEDCMNDAHAPAHRHDRVWYRPNPSLLSNIKQWIEACQNCHSIVDNEMSTEEKEELFQLIRGDE